MVSEKGVAESRCERRLKRNTKVSNALAEAYKSQEIRLFGENQGLKKRGKRSFFFFLFFPRRPRCQRWGLLRVVVVELKE